MLVSDHADAHAERHAESRTAVDPACLVMMGVSGSGKSTIGLALAARSRAVFLDADELHSPHAVEKMTRGESLDDADRVPWLGRVADRIATEAEHHDLVVVACSALRRTYRDLLRARASVPLTFVHLHGPAEFIGTRMRARAHFMPPALLQSQLAALEPLGDDERGFVIDNTAPPDEVVAEIFSRLRRSTGRGV